VNNDQQLEQIYREMPDGVRQQVARMSMNDEPSDEWLKSLVPCKRVKFKRSVAVGFGK
jgi:hypothetical protein